VSESQFRPTGDEVKIDPVYATTEFYCPCERSVFLCTLDDGSTICVCGRQYRLMARVEVDDSEVAA
jgi:hypothetical protein